jgi:probable phosphomutase (TIGR03848 family)
MTQVLLIRHASNDWVGQRLAGWTPGVQLNARGRAEAAALAARLEGYRIDAVYASPLDRTRETAAFIAAPRGLDIHDLPDVGEVRFGTWTGQELATLRKDPLWSGVQHAPSHTRFPEGETLGEVQARALAAIETVRAAHPEDQAVVAVVSHADVIKTLVAHYAGVHLDLFQRFSISPASVSVVRFMPDGPRVLVVNATGDLPGPPDVPPSDAPPAEAPLSDTTPAAAGTAP